MENKQIIILILGIGLLALLYFAFKPQGQKTVNNQSQATASASPQVQSFNLQIKDKKLVVGTETITVKEGNLITLKITSDQDGELHLHGYDQSVNLQKDKTVELSFKANLTGHFGYELEESKTEIGAIEVQPQ